MKKGKPWQHVSKTRVGVGIYWEHKSKTGARGVDERENMVKLVSKTGAGGEDERRKTVGTCK